MASQAWNSGIYGCVEGRSAWGGGGGENKMKERTMVLFAEMHKKLDASYRMVDWTQNVFYGNNIVSSHSQYLQMSFSFYPLYFVYRHFSLHFLILEEEEMSDKREFENMDSVWWTRNNRHAAGKIVKKARIILYRFMQFCVLPRLMKAIHLYKEIEYGIWFGYYKRRP